MAVFRFSVQKDIALTHFSVPSKSFRYGAGSASAVASASVTMPATYSRALLRLIQLEVYLLSVAIRALR